MKILYVANFDLPDFQSDMIFHGLRSLLGEDVVDLNEAWYMYDDFRNHWADRVPEKGMSYGRGFTLYGRLPKLKIDRTDIKSKIQNHYFDKIVYGSVTRCQTWLQTVFENYDRVRDFTENNLHGRDIVLIDGEDNTDISPDFTRYENYYKRELLPEYNAYGVLGKMKPINFCIPKELIVSSVPKKEKDYATIIPGDTSTYIYTEEKPYFEDYQKSYFGVTCKKGGWDCLRHYEILMNGCVPFFPGLEQCPETTLTRFPKALVLDAMNKIKKENDLSFYEECVTLLLDWTRKNLTTEEVAKSLL